MELLIVIAYAIILIYEISTKYKRYVLKEKITSLIFILFQALLSVLYMKDFTVYSPIDLLEKLMKKIVNI